MPKKSTTTNTKSTPAPAKTEDKKATKEQTAPALIVPNTKVTITIPWETAEPAYKKARASVAKNVKISGFRKGKVPADVAEKMLGSEQIIEKALQEVLPEAYIATVKKADKKPLTQPSFQAVATEVGQEWVIEAQIAERPEIKLDGYEKTVKAAQKEADKAITEQEATIKKQIAEAEKAKKKTEESDSKEEAHQHIHTPQPLNDEQKKEIRLQKIYEALIENFKPQVPELLVRHEVEYDLEQLGRQLQAIQMSFEDYLKRRGITQEQLTQQMAMGALNRIQLVFIIDTLADTKKLAVSDAELKQYLEEKVDPQTRAQYANSTEYTSLVRQTILRQKVADSLLAI